jgi:hypothetical protein
MGHDGEVADLSGRQHRFADLSKVGKCLQSDKIDARA